MKKIITNTATRLSLALLLLITQFNAFAADATTGEATKWQIVSNMPEFWVGVALFVVFVSLFLITGKKRNEVAV